MLDGSVRLTHFFSIIANGLTVAFSFACTLVAAFFTAHESLLKAGKPEGITSPRLNT